MSRELSTNVEMNVLNLGMQKLASVEVRPE